MPRVSSRRSARKQKARRGADELGERLPAIIDELVANKLRE